MKDSIAIEEQAAQLARWLGENPGAPPPEGMDPEVLEAIYVLRPDLAPAPSFTIDDILADITTGPFTGTAGEARADSSADIGKLAELIPLHEEPHQDLVTEETSAPTTENEPQAPVVDLITERRRRRPWLWTGVGAMAAAAMALFVIMPFIDQGVPDLAQLAGQAEPTPAAVPSADFIAELEDQEAPPSRSQLEQKVDIPDRTAEPGPAQPAAAPIADLDAAPQAGASAASGPGLATARTTATSAAGSSAMTDQPSRATKEQPREQSAPLPEASTAPADWYAPNTTASPDAVEPAEPATATLRRDEAGEADDGWSNEPMLEERAGADFGGIHGAVEEPAPVTTPAADAGLAYDDLADEDYGVADERRQRERLADQLVAEEEEETEYERSESVSRSVAAKRRGLSIGGGRSSGRSKPSSGRADAATAEALPPSPPTGQATLGIDELRAQANPLDYHSHWYTTDPALDETTRAQLADAYARSQAAVVAGDLAAALAALEPVLGSAHPRAVQDVSFQIATLQLQAGAPSTALSMVSTGLAASSSPTVFRSRLLALQGSILEELGDSARARGAYQQAVQANATRY